MNDEQLEGLVRAGLQERAPRQVPASMVERASGIPSIAPSRNRGPSRSWFGVPVPVAIAVAVVAVVVVALPTSVGIVGGMLGPNGAAPQASPDATSPLGASTPGASAAASLPPMRSLVPFQEAALAEDRRTLTLEFIGAKEYSPGNPCSADYAAWAEADGEVLRAAVMDITPEPPDGPVVECAAIGYPRTVTTTLPEPFNGTVVEDFTGGSHVLDGQGTPASPAAVELDTVVVPFAGRTMSVALVGRPGIITDWRAATSEELLDVTWQDRDSIGLAGISEREIVLAWTGTVCDIEATVTITEHKLVVSPAPRGGCDAVAVARGVLLAFEAPVDPAAIDVAIADGAPAINPWGPLAVIPGQDGTDTARTEGILRIAEGCAYLETGDERVLLVWPADRVRWDVRSGDIEFDNPDGTTESVMDGDLVVLGGGGGSTEEDGPWFAAMDWITSPPDGCPLGAYWSVGSVER